METVRAPELKSADLPSLEVAEALLRDCVLKMRSNIRLGLKMALDAEQIARDHLELAGARNDPEPAAWPQLPRPWLRVLAQSWRRQVSAKSHLSDNTDIGPLRERTEPLLLYLGEHEELASLVIALGVAAYDQSDFGQALRHYGQARQWADHLEDSHLHGVIFQNEGNVWAELGEYARAIDCYEAARESINRSNHPGAQRILASILMNLGAVYQDYRRCDFAQVVFQEALKVEQGVDDPIIRSKILASLGVLENIEKRYHEACAYLEASLQLKEQVGDRAGAVFCLLTLATNLRMSGAHADAARLLTRAEAGALEIDHQRWLCSAYLERGHLYADEAWSGANLDEALLSAQQAASIALDIDYKDMLCQAHRLQAELLDRTQRHREAYAALLKANDYRIAFSEEEAERKLALMRVLHEVKDAREEAARVRQRNDELARLLEEKDAFMGIAAHDLKNPLSAIIALVHELRLEDNSPEEVEQGLLEVEQSASHMLAIVRNLLDLNRYESAEIKPDWAECDLAEVIYFAADSNRPAAEAKSITLHFQFTAEEVLYRTDPVMIRQIVDNLVSNAIKFSGPLTRVEVSFHRTGQGFRLCVKDEGPGIPRDEQPRVFERFVRTVNRPTAGEHSTGLGLAIVKRLTILLGAFVTLESEPGAGSTFSIIFPLDT
ncbi:MAG: tetratricopeptide repeat-containing sensor histidine kinase [Opitutales bacterium]|nr:tetratricopeptide repeat-containing sensor histidine kinase [Opitutales bacterium]